MKKTLLAIPLLLALLGCGDDQPQAKKEFQVKSAPKDESTVQMEKTIEEQKRLLAEQEKRLKMMEDLVTEVKAKQDEADKALEIFELAKKNRKGPENK